jgi:hypothetical protein
MTTRFCIFEFASHSAIRIPQSAFTPPPFRNQKLSRNYFSLVQNPVIPTGIFVGAYCIRPGGKWQQQQRRKHCAPTTKKLCPQMAQITT